MAIRPTLATVDLAAVRHNLGVAQQLAPGAAMCAIVKANAYGHGLVPIGSVLAEAGAEWLAVALIEEGIALRQAGVKTPLLVLGAALEGGYDALIKHDLVPVLFREDQLVRLAKAAGKGKARFHLKIDTGMARLGLRLDGLASFLSVLDGLPTTELDGVLTHFANADLADREFNEEQLALFRRACQQINAGGHRPRWAHIANSAAVLTFPEAHGKLVRPGLMLYGLDGRQPLSRRQIFLFILMLWKNLPSTARSAYLAVPSCRLRTHS
jgi:alanine racemase